MIQNPHELFVNFDCFVSASKAEGLPLALIESLSLGKAFICSDIEPHKKFTITQQASVGTYSTVPEERFDKVL